MKKLLLMLLAAPLFFAACSDDDTDFITNPPAVGEDLAEENTAIVEGVVKGEMRFRGKYTVTDKNGVIGYENQGAKFNITTAGTGLGVEMNGVKFADGMPALDIRMQPIDYAGEGKAVHFIEDKIIPEAFIKAAGWQPFDKYPMTEVRGEVNGLRFTITMKCMNVYTIRYEGQLLK